MRKLLLIVISSFFALDLFAATQNNLEIQTAGLKSPARVVRDTNDIPHIKARNDHDLFFLQGYLQAQDRLFQMDVSRRRASGTLAELIGAGALAQDVQLRTMGIRRAAERSWPLQSDRVRAILQAYTDGLNAYVASHPLPPEYAALKISHFDCWTPVDSLAAIKLIAFAESFQSDIQPTVDLLSYQAVGRALGFDGTKLFFEDVERSAPFDPASTVPDASATGLSAAKEHHWAGLSADFLEDSTIEMAKEYDTKTANLDIFRNSRGGQPDDFSNEWAISGSATSTGAPLMANDPHLDLGTPATWYPIHLQARGLDVIGESLPGANRCRWPQSLSLLGPD